MWNEITPEGKRASVPATNEDAIQLMERTMPALFTQTTFEVKRLFDALIRANPHVNAHVGALKIPAAAGRTFKDAIEAIDEVRQDETYAHGGVFIPYEGSPWTGFRAGSALPADLNREAYAHNHIFEQMLSSSLALLKNLKIRTESDGKMVFEAYPRDVQHLYSIYSCPAAESWVPPTGFRYKEVRNALIEATGGPAAEINAHVMQALALIPESRIMPRLTEIMATGDQRIVSRRVAVNEGLAASQAALGFEVEIAAPKPAERRVLAPVAGTMAREEQRAQMAMDL
jgi:hypothetical protein